MEEVGALRKTFGSRNNCATPQDKIHFKKFFFFCRRIGAPLNAKPERTALGQRFCHGATQDRGSQCITRSSIFDPRSSVSRCLRRLLCDTQNIPNGRVRVGTTSAWKS